MKESTADLQRVNVRAAKGPIGAEEFELWGSFAGIVPIDENTPEEKARSLNCKVTEAIQARIGIFGSLLNLVLREGNFESWVAIDVFLIGLATLLEEKGLYGALDATSPKGRGVGSFTRGDGVPH
jgi:hypothetical protein